MRLDYPSAEGNDAGSSGNEPTYCSRKVPSSGNPPWPVWISHPNPIHPTWGSPLGSVQTVILGLLRTGTNAGTQ